MGDDTTARRWRDPWPSPQAPYYDPPWVMRGRAVTAWFQAPWDVATAILSPDLLPPPAAFVRARLRFYDLDFEAVSPATLPLAVRKGRFREGVIALAARYAELDGEVSTFLWTDSQTYLMWGREVFDWPIGLARVELTGSLWVEGVDVGKTGDARIVDACGSASLVDVRVTGEAARGTPSGHWLTPRRILHGAGCDGETRELLIVRPTVSQPGSTYIGTGCVRFNFDAPHPLQRLGETEAQIEVADGFELLVGADVEVVLPERSAGPGT